MKNGLDEQYIDLLKDILENGVEKDTRNGKTLSVFGRSIRYKFKDGKFPLLTTKRIPFKLVVTELLWFLQGRTDLRFLLGRGCNIWTGDAYKVYDKDFDREHPAFSAPYPKRLTVKEFEEKIMTDDEFNKWYGDLGPIYGKQWRRWNGQVDDISGIGCYHDQIENLIHDLKTNPDSRRLMVNAWNVAELDQMVLPPCHYSFQVYTRELSIEERLDLASKTYGELFEPFDFHKVNHEEIDELYPVPRRAISLMFNMRSVDTFLGLPFNIASYGLLLEIIAKEVNMVPDELIGNLGDTHLYSNHVEQALEQIGRELRVDERVCMCYENPKLDLRKIQEGMSDSEFTKVCDEFCIPTRTRVPYLLPKLVINDEFWNPDAGLLEQIEYIKIHDFEIRDYQSHSVIKAKLSN